MVVFFLFFMSVFLGSELMAYPVVADLSTHEIKIDSNFKGQDILVFGAFEEKGDIVISVRGPRGSILISKKDNIMGMWVNVSRIRFDEVDLFHINSSSKDISMFSDNIIKNLHIASDGINFELHEVLMGDEYFNVEARKAISDLHDERIVYENNFSEVDYIGDHLFRSVIHFSDNVPAGMYTVEVFLFDEGGKLLSSRFLPLKIEEVGLGSLVLKFSRKNPVFYGFFSILLALFLGWIGFTSSSRR